jgi:hypothetical protein
LTVSTQESLRNEPLRGLRRRAATRATLFDVILDQRLDHPVTCPAVSAGAARLGHGLRRVGSALDGGQDLFVRYGEANANVHPLLIMKSTFIFNKFFGK